jgi:predicted phosphodiesterase
MSLEKIVFLTDIHAPHNIELGPIFEFIQDFKPNKIVLGGDIHDFTSVCQWIADQSRTLVGGTILQNHDELKRVVLEPLHKAAPKAEITYITGNHEDWLRQAVSIKPEFAGLVELERHLPKQIRLLQLNQAYHVNKHLCFLHGLYTTKYHAFQTVHAVHKSVFYGHTHDIQRYTDISPVDVSQFYTGASCGCLCTLNPSYMKNKPNRWVNGFLFLYVDTKTDEFFENQVYIVHNKFVAEGRLYA